MSLVWSGNLSKKGRGNSFFGRNSWKTRFFRLFGDGTLCYFANERSTKMKKGQLEVRTVYVPPADTAPKGKTNYFEIRAVDKEGGRTLAVCAETPEQMNVVVGHLQRITAPAPAPAPPAPPAPPSSGSMPTSPATTTATVSPKAPHASPAASNSSSHTMSLPRSPSPQHPTSSTAGAGAVAVTPPSLPSRGVPSLPPGLGLRPEDLLGDQPADGGGAPSGPVIPGADSGEPPLFNLDIRLKTGNQVMVPYYRGVDPTELAQTFGKQYELSDTSVKKLSHVIRANLQRVAATDPSALVAPASSTAATASTVAPAAPPAPPSTGPQRQLPLYDPSRSALDQFEHGEGVAGEVVEEEEEEDLDSQDEEEDTVSVGRRGRTSTSSSSRRRRKLTRHGSSASGFDDRASVKSNRSRGRSRSRSRSTSRVRAGTASSRARSSSRRRTGPSSSSSSASKSASRPSVRPPSRTGSPESVGRSSYLSANRKGRYTKSRMPATAHERERLVSTPEPMVVDPRSSQERPEWRPVAGAPSRAAMWDVSNGTAWSVASPDRRSRLDGASSVGSPAQSVDPRSGRKGRFQRRAGGSRKPAVPSRFAPAEPHNPRSRSRSRSRSKSRGRVRVKVGSSVDDGATATPPRGGAGAGSGVSAAAGLLDVDKGLLGSDLDDTPKGADGPAGSSKSSSHHHNQQRRGRSTSVGRMRPVSSSLLAPTIASSAKTAVQDDGAVGSKRGGHRSRSRSRNAGDRFSYVKPRIYQAAEEHVKSARTRRELESRTVAEKLKDTTFGPPPPLPLKKTPSIMSLQRPLVSKPHATHATRASDRAAPTASSSSSSSSSSEVARLQGMVRDGYAKIAAVEAMAAALEKSMTQLRQQLQDKEETGGGSGGSDALSPESSQLHQRLMKQRVHQGHLEQELADLKTSVRAASLSLSTVPPSAAPAPGGRGQGRTDESTPSATTSAGPSSSSSPEHILNWGTDGDDGGGHVGRVASASASPAPAPAPAPAGMPSSLHSSFRSNDSNPGDARRRVPPLPLLDPASVTDSPAGRSDAAAFSRPGRGAGSVDDGDDALDELGLPDEDHPLSTADHGGFGANGGGGHLTTSLSATGAVAATTTATATTTTTTTTSNTTASISWGMLANLSDDESDQDDSEEDDDDEDEDGGMGPPPGGVLLDRHPLSTAVPELKVQKGGIGGNLDVDSDESDPDEVVFGDDDDHHFDELGLADLGTTF